MLKLLSQIFCPMSGKKKNPESPLGEELQCLFRSDQCVCQAAIVMNTVPPLITLAFNSPKIFNHRLLSDRDCKTIEVAKPTEWEYSSKK